VHPGPVRTEYPLLRVRTQACRQLKEQEARVALPFAPRCSCSVQGKVVRYNFKHAEACLWSASAGSVSLSRGLSFKVKRALDLLMQRQSLGPGKTGLHEHHEIYVPSALDPDILLLMVSISETLTDTILKGSSTSRASTS
jgi:hypothetical protein